MFGFDFGLRKRTKIPYFPRARKAHGLKAEKRSISPHGNEEEIYLPSLLRVSLMAEEAPQEGRLSVAVFSGVVGEAGENVERYVAVLLFAMP